MMACPCEHRERCLRLDGRLGKAFHRLVEAPRLVSFVVEILHGFIVQKAVDGLGVRILVALVHVAAELMRHRVMANVNQTYRTTMTIVASANQALKKYRNTALVIASSSTVGKC